jgi:hypothetical protein
VSDRDQKRAGDRVANMPAVRLERKRAYDRWRSRKANISPARVEARRRMMDRRRAAAVERAKQPIDWEALFKRQAEAMLKLFGG